MQVRNCKLVGLPDLLLSKDYVANKIVEYMNRLISIGVAGFRIDAAKHMWPNDLNKVITKLDNLPSR
jgi:alpha-amylase